MKKLFKSILISTASIGMVAGTTATVVSCGEEDQTKHFSDVWNSRFGKGIDQVSDFNQFDSDDIKSAVVSAADAVIDYLKLDFNDKIDVKDLNFITLNAPYRYGDEGTSIFYVTFHNKNDSSKTYRSDLLAWNALQEANYF